MIRTGPLRTRTKLNDDAFPRVWREGLRSIKQSPKKQKYISAGDSSYGPIIGLAIIAGAFYYRQCASGKLSRCSIK